MSGKEFMKVIGCSVVMQCELVFVYSVKCL
jgi:hypothetical protein